MSDEAIDAPDNSEFIEATPPVMANDAAAIAPAAAELEPELRPQYEAAMGGISLFRALSRAVGIGLPFAIVGALTGVHEFANLALPHIVSPDNPADYQETLVGLPVPHLLDWNPAKIEFLQIVGGLSGLIVTLCFLGFYGGLIAHSISALNPTFRLLRIRSASAQYRWLAFDSAALGKAFRAALWPGLALGLVWLLTMRLPGRAGDFAGEIRFVAIGMSLWTAFGVRGRAGDFSRSELQKVRPALLELALPGAVFGMAAYVLMQSAAPVALGPLLTRWQALGTFHRGYLNFVAARYLGGNAAAWFGMGTLLLAIGQPQLRVSQRFGVLILPLLALWGAVTLQKPFQPETLAARYDMTGAIGQTVNTPYYYRSMGSGVPEGADAARELAARAAIPTKSTLFDRSLLLFTPGRVLIARQAGVTQDGLPLGPATLGPVRDILAQRQYETALSWTAIRHLFNIHTAEFDTTAAMSDLLLDLTRCPHLLQSNGTLFGMFHTCAATPENLALLDQYADLSQFARPDRESLRNTGDLYRRFGATEKAMQWYRRAEMPKTFMTRIASEKPMFHAGRITGILRLNGKPLAGVAVAAEPFHMNGLTPSLEPQVLQNGYEIVARDGMPPRFGPYHPVPFAFRFLSAATRTDAKGRFEIQNLTEGSYWLLTRLPNAVELLPPMDARLKAQNVPGEIDLKYSTPVYDAKTIDLTFATGGTL